MIFLQMPNVIMNENMKQLSTEYYDNYVKKIDYVSKLFRKNWLMWKIFVHISWNFVTLPTNNAFSLLKLKYFEQKEMEGRV